MGLYFLSISIAWGGALFCQFGTSMLAVKWVATARAKGDEPAVGLAVWSLIQFTILQGLAVFACFYFVPRSAELRWIWGLWTFAVGLQTLMPEILRGFNDLKWASLLGGPVPQLITVLVVGVAHFAYKQVSFERIATLCILSSFAASSIGLGIIISRAKYTWLRIPYKLFLIEALPIGMSLAATYVLSQADLWVCGTLLKNEDVAVYGIAQRFNAFVSMPLMIFGSVAMPTMAELFATRDMNRLKSVIVRGTFVTTLITLFVFIGGVLVGWPAMRFLLGRDYTASYPVFLFLGFGQFLHAYFGPNGYLLLLCGEQKVAMIGTILAALFLFISALIFGHYWGIHGIAAASALSLTAQSIWMWYQVRIRLNLYAHFRWVPNWRGT